MWVRFIRDFDWSPRYGVTIAYKAGMLLNVTRRCANGAVNSNCAEPAHRPSDKD